MRMTKCQVGAREERARQLAECFVKFAADIRPLLIAVRTDFYEKPRGETILDCRTFSEYCEKVLHYSPRHIARLIAGDNPAAEKFDGSKHRLPTPVTMVEPDTRPLCAAVQEIHLALDDLSEYSDSELDQLISELEHSLAVLKERIRAAA